MTRTTDSSNQSLHRSPFADRPWEFRLSLALHAAIPAVTLVWSFASAFFFWGATFGSPWIALGAVVTVEALGLLGFAMHVLDVTSSRFWRTLRFLLPLLPVPSLLFSLHGIVGAHATWIADAALRLRLDRDGMAWAVAIVLTVVVVTIAWGSWNALEALLIDPVAHRMRAIHRRHRMLERERAMSESELDLEYALQRAQLQARLSELSIRCSIADARAKVEAAEAHRLSEERDAVRRALIALERQAAVPAAAEAPPSLQAPQEVALAGDETADDLRSPATIPDVAPPWRAEDAARLALAAFLFLAGVPQRQVIGRSGVSRRRVDSLFRPDPSRAALTILHGMLERTPESLARAWRDLSVEERATVAARLPSSVRRFVVAERPAEPRVADLRGERPAAPPLLHPVPLQQTSAPFLNGRNGRTDAP